MDKSNVHELPNQEAKKALKKSEHLQNQIKALAEVVNNHSKQFGEIGVFQGYSHGTLEKRIRQQEILIFGLIGFVGVMAYVIRKNIQNGNLEGIEL